MRTRAKILRHVCCFLLTLHDFRLTEKQNFHDERSARQQRRRRRSKEEGREKKLHRQSYRSFWGLFSKSFTRILSSILTTLDTNIRADASRRDVFAATEVIVAARRGFFELACQRHVRPHPILHHVPIDGGMFFSLSASPDRTLTLQQKYSTGWAEW